MLIPGSGQLQIPLSSHFVFYVMHTTPGPSSAPTTPPDFDKRSFLKSMKDIGRPYRKRAAKLVSICRTFVQAQNKTPDSHYKLRSALQLVDDALMSATQAGKKTSKKADEAFKNAVSKLGDYEREYHFMETVAESIKIAEEVDKSSMKVLNSLIEKFRPLEEGPTTKVEFLLHKSLPDKNPTVITQVLCSKSDQKEILWNFSRFKDERRLTLKQNPRFYEALPASPKDYGDKFLIEPIETYLHKMHKRISVLTDSLGEAGRVFLNLAKKTRAFGNVWIPKNAIIFKDVCGKLEGESGIDKAIQDTPNLWCFTEPPPSLASRSSSSSNRSSPSPTTTATPTTSSTGLLLTDWREPIRQMLRSPDVNIRISTKPPINSFPSSPAPSSPQSGFSSSVGSLPPIYELPPAGSPPARPSPESLSKLPSQPAAVPALNTSVPLPMPLPQQPFSVASPSTSSATPARTTSPLPDTHSGGMPKEGSTFSGDTIPSQPLIAGVTITPHAERHEAKVAGHVLSQRPGPSYQHEVAGIVTPDPLLQQHVPAVLPKLQVPEPQISKRKKNWFQRHIYDYGK